MLPSAHRLYCYLHMRHKSEEQRQIYNLARTALIHNHNQQIGVPSRRLVEERAAAAATAKNNYSKHLLLLDKLATRTQGTSQQQLYNHNKDTSSTPSTSTLCTRGATIARGRVRDVRNLLSIHIYPLFPSLYSITSLTIHCVGFNSSNQLLTPHLMA